MGKTGKTKKVGSTGRFGPRYGSRLRKRVLEIERQQKGKIKCPKCDSRVIKRISTGVWFCRRCGAKMTGGAWQLQTAQGKVSWRVATSKANL